MKTRIGVKPTANMRKSQYGRGSFTYKGLSEDTMVVSQTFPKFTLSTRLLSPEVAVE